MIESMKSNPKILNEFKYHLVPDINLEETYFQMKKNKETGLYEPSEDLSDDIPLYNPYSKKDEV